MKWEEYEEIASSLVDWLQEVTDLMLDKNFPTTYNELKVSISVITSVTGHFGHRTLWTHKIHTEVS